MSVRRILVVDDDPDVTEYFESFLGDEGFDVSTAGSSAEAFSMIDEVRPHAILIDVLMPGRSGLDLLVRIRRHPRWGAVPLVVISGSDQILEDSCHSYLDSHQGVRGPDGVLAKPVERTVLLAVLDDLCRSTNSCAPRSP